MPKISKCGKCRGDLIKDQSILCQGTCKLLMHFLCADVSDSVYRNMSREEKNIFICTACLNLNKSQAETEILNRPKKAHVFDKSELDSVKNKFEQINSDITIVSDVNFLKDAPSDLYTLLKSEFDKMRKEINEQITTSTETSQKLIINEIFKVKNLIDSNNTQIKYLFEQNKVMNQKISEIEQENVNLTSQINELKTENKQNKLEINELSQYSRKLNLEINGVIELPNEKIDILMNKLGSILNVKPDGIIAVHRVPSKFKAIKPIIMRFRSFYEKMIWLDSAKKNEIQTNQIVDTDASNRIFINHHLSPFNKFLFYQAKKKKLSLDYKFLWYNNGYIYLRKENNSRIIKITSEEDIHKIAI